MEKRDCGSLRWKNKGALGDGHDISKKDHG